MEEPTHRNTPLVGRVGMVDGVDLRTKDREEYSLIV